jgi:hypothetical protein
MPSDPRLNLFNFAGTILNRNPSVFGIPHATACPSTLHRLEQGGRDATNAMDSTLGVVGDFANFASSIAMTAGNKGAGSVGEGLLNLARVSDQVRRNGTSALPGSAVNNGQKWVLDEVGIDHNVLIQSQQFNPSVVNAALGSASQVYNAVSQGKFNVGDIPAAFSAFQNGAALITSLFTPNDSTSQPQGTRFGQMCGASPYAMDLIALAPKYKFLFVVQFEFDPQFQQEISSTINPAFVVKASTRPTVEFEYEDINMYNFRTKVPKRTVYQPMTMRFYDDDHNHAFQFYTTYLKLVSPIANIDAENVKGDILDMYDLAGGGMGFTADFPNGREGVISTAYTNTVGQRNAASFGTFGRQSDPAAHNIRNVLRRITVFHVYRQGRMMNVINFYNPKITKMDLDDLDMSVGSEGNEVSLTFTYDSMFIIPGYRIFNDNTLGYNLPDMTGDGSLMFPFGVNPDTAVEDGNPKDGFQLPYGQKMVEQNQTGLSEVDVTARKIGNTKTATGTDLSAIAPVLGAIGAGAILSKSGNNQLPTSVQAKTIAEVATNGSFASSPTQARTIRDPITGDAPTSAANTKNLVNVNVDATNRKVSASAAKAAADAAATTPEQRTANQNTYNNQVANINNTTSSQTNVSRGVEGISGPTGS